MNKIIESVKAFFNKWYNRFRIFCYSFAIWSVFYSSISICGFSVAFEYDDGIAYTEDVKRNAKENGKDNIYYAINGNTELERTKIVPFLSLFFLKILGFKIDFILDREPINIQSVNKKWNGWANGIYFVSDQNQKYELLESKKYIFFFSNSDEGVIQAKKAGIKAVRIKRNPKSLSNNLSYNPGKFGEWTLPLSEF